jgi:tetratricopeptide (TPR) repeat protein
VITHPSLSEAQHFAPLQWAPMLAALLIMAAVVLCLLIIKSYPALKKYRRLRKRQRFLAELFMHRITRVAQEKKVPVDFVARVLKNWGIAGYTFNGEVNAELALARKADEFRALRIRLRSTSKRFPYNAMLRETAATALDDDQFPVAARCLREAQQRFDLATTQRGAAAAIEKAENIAELAMLYRLHPTPYYYREAARDFGRASALAEAFEDQALRYRYWQARTLYDLGEEFGDTDALKESMALGRKTLAVFERRLNEFDTQSPPMSQDTQQPFEPSFGVIENSEIATLRMKKTVSSFRDRLKKQTHDEMRLDWAQCRRHIGKVAQSLGERLNDKAYLEEAANCYRDAIRVYANAPMAQEWAMTKMKMGGVLLRLSRLTKDTTHAANACIAFERAMTIFTRNRTPETWAELQCMLGASLTYLGERKHDNKALQRAITASREALKVMTRPTCPLDWAVAKKTLGNALRALGSRTRDQAMLQEAISAYNEALEVLENSALYYADEARLHLVRANTTLREILKGKDQPRHSIIGRSVWGNTVNSRV